LVSAHHPHRLDRVSTLPGVGLELEDGGETVLRMVVVVWELVTAVSSILGWEVGITVLRIVVVGDPVVICIVGGSTLICILWMWEGSQDGSYDG